MAKDPQGEKPRARSPLTGTAQPVTNSVERARRFLKDHPEPHAAPSKRKSVRPKRPELDEEPGAKGFVALPLRPGELYTEVFLRRMKYQMAAATTTTTTTTRIIHQ